MDDNEQQAQALHGGLLLPGTDNGCYFEVIVQMLLDSPGIISCYQRAAQEHTLLQDRPFVQLVAALTSGNAADDAHLQGIIDRLRAQLSPRFTNSPGAATNLLLTNSGGYVAALDDGHLGIPGVEDLFWIYNDHGPWALHYEQTNMSVPNTMLLPDVANKEFSEMMLISYNHSYENPDGFVPPLEDHTAYNRYLGHSMYRLKFVVIASGNADGARRTHSVAQHYKLITYDFMSGNYVMIDPSGSRGVMHTSTYFEDYSELREYLTNEWRQVSTNRNFTSAYFPVLAVYALQGTISLDRTVWPRNVLNMNVGRVLFGIRIIQARRMASLRLLRAAAQQPAVPVGGYVPPQPLLVRRRPVTFDNVPAPQEQPENQQQTLRQRGLSILAAHSTPSTPARTASAARQIPQTPQPNIQGSRQTTVQLRSQRSVSTTISVSQEAEFFVRLSSQEAYDAVIYTFGGLKDMQMNAAVRYAVITLLAMQNDWISLVRDEFGEVASTSTLSWQREFVTECITRFSHAKYGEPLAEVVRSVASIFKMGPGTGKTFAIIFIAFVSLFDWSSGRAAGGNSGKVFIIEPKNILVLEIGNKILRAVSTNAGAYLMTRAEDSLFLSGSRAIHEDSGNLTEYGRAVRSAENTVNITSKTTPIILQLKSIIISTPEKAQGPLSRAFTIDPLFGANETRGLSTMLRSCIIDEAHLVVEGSRSKLLDTVVMMMRVINKPVFYFSGTLSESVIAALQQSNPTELRVYESANSDENTSRYTVKLYKTPQRRSILYPEKLKQTRTKGRQGRDAYYVPGFGEASFKKSFINVYASLIEVSIIQSLIHTNRSTSPFGGRRSAHVLRALHDGMIDDRVTPRALVFINNKVQIEATFVVTVTLAVLTNRVAFSCAAECLDDVEESFENIKMILGDSNLSNIVTRTAAFAKSEYAQLYVQEAEAFVNEHFKSARAIFNAGVNLGIFMNYADMDFGYLESNRARRIINSCILGEKDARYPVSIVISTSVVQEGTNLAPLSLLVIDPSSYSRMNAEDMRQLQGRIGRQRDGIIIAFEVDDQLKLPKTREESQQIILENEADERIQFVIDAYLSIERMEWFRQLSDEQKIRLLSPNNIKILNSMSMSSVYGPDGSVIAGATIDMWFTEMANLRKDAMKILHNFSDEDAVAVKGIPVRMLVFYIMCIFETRSSFLELIDVGGINDDEKLKLASCASFFAASVCLSFMTDKVSKAKRGPLDGDQTNETRFTAINNKIASFYLRCYTTELNKDLAESISEFTLEAIYGFAGMPSNTREYTRIPLISWYIEVFNRSVIISRQLQAAQVDQSVKLMILLAAAKGANTFLSSIASNMNTVMNQIRYNNPEGNRTVYPALADQSTRINENTAITDAIFRDEVVSRFPYRYSEAAFIQYVADFIDAERITIRVIRDVVKAIASET